MKFTTLDDKKLFLLEVERIDLLGSVCDEWSPPTDLLELFVQKRKGLIRGLKDFRKSQISKAQWRKNRYAIMKGIKKFHKSSQGKRMHRSLGRFMATRFSGDTDSGMQGIVGQSREESFMTIDLFQEVSEVLKALSSLRTRIYIETEHYMPVTEYVEFLEFTEDVLEASFTLEKGLLRFDASFDEKDLDIIARAVEPGVLIDEVSKVKGLEFAQAMEEFNSQVALEEKSYIEIMRGL